MLKQQKYLFHKKSFFLKNVHKLCISANFSGKP